ncbi:MAG: hypothetical protein HQK84_01585 [Nitrospinae bacterium]|nr:hypothetical protein [Nitrospinota bacterium]
MNMIYTHLLLNDVPVIGSFLGIVLLIFGCYFKSEDIIKVSFGFLMVIGMATIPVYSTGNYAELYIEDLAGVTKTLTDTHERSAIFALAALMFLATITASALVVYRKKPIPKWVVYLTLVYTLYCGWVVTGTAKLGGQIRHTEIRPHHPDNEQVIKKEKEAKLSDRKKPQAMQKGLLRNANPLH